MCKKCWRAGKKSKLAKGKIRSLAYIAVHHKYASIPLFDLRVDNLAVEGEIWRLRLGQTYINKYSQIEVCPLTD